MGAPRQWHFYLLECSDGTLYAGITNDLQRRLALHNRGRASRYTRARLPVELLYSEPHPDRSSAVRRESRVRRMPRAAKLALAGGERGRPLRRATRGRETKMTAEEMIATLGLVLLDPEGGFFRETHRSALRIPAGALRAKDGAPRACSTAIYYLLTAETISAMHRLPWDEVFHFYMGDPVEMLQLPPDGPGRVVTLGAGLAEGMRPQVVVPAGTWQGARLKKGGAFALMGTTVAPGFEPADFEPGRRDALVASHPAFRELIVALTR